MDLQNSKIGNFFNNTQDSKQNLIKKPLSEETPSAFNITPAANPPEEADFTNEALAILEQIDGGKGEYVVAGSYEGTIGAPEEAQTATASNAQTPTPVEVNAENSPVSNLMRTATQNFLTKTLNNAQNAAEKSQKQKLQKDPKDTQTIKSSAPDAIAETEAQKEASKEVMAEASKLVGKIISITVEKWIKGSLGNNCLENIIKNNYDLVNLGIKLYDEKYNNLEKAVMDANPEIYGDENGNGSREKIIDGTRHNAVLQPGDVIQLPKYENIAPIDPQEPIEAEDGEIPAPQEKKSRYDSKEELIEATKDLRKTDLGAYLESIDDDKYYYTNYDESTGDYKVTTYIKDKDTDALRQIIFDASGKKADIFEMRKDGSLLTPEEVADLETK